MAFKTAPKTTRRLWLNDGHCSAVLLRQMEACAQPQGHPGRSRVVHLPVTVVEGSVQKPAAFYVLNRAPLNTSAAELRTSFVRDVTRSAERAPF